MNVARPGRWISRAARTTWENYGGRIFLVTLALIFGYFIVFVVPAGADFSGTFSKVRPITLAGNTSVMTNYTVGVNVTWDSDMQHFDYVCFYDNDNITTYDYWIQEMVAEQFAYYRVEISAALVWLAYDNSSASPCSANGSGTFLGFDDFNDGVMSWDATGGNAFASITEADGIIKLVHDATDGHDNVLMWNESINETNIEIVAEMYTYNTGAANWIPGLLAGWDGQYEVAAEKQPYNAIAGIGIVTDHSLKSFLFTNGAGSYANGTTPAGATVNGTWFTGSMRRIINGFYYTQNLTDGDVYYSVVRPHNYTAILMEYSANNEAWVNWWFVKKAMVVEPIATVGDEVEITGGGAAAMEATLTSPENGSSYAVNENFTLSANINCSSGDCETVSVYPQYRYPATEGTTSTWTITNSSDFNGGTVDSNALVYDGNLTINHSLSFTTIDTDISTLDYGCAAMTSNERVGDDEVFMVYQGCTDAGPTCTYSSTNATVFYPGNDTFSANMVIGYYGQDGIIQSHPHPRMDYMKSEYVMYYGPYGYFWTKNSTDGVSWGDFDDKIQIFGLPGGQDVEASQCQWVNDSTCYLCGRRTASDNKENLTLWVVNINASHPNGYWASDMPSYTIHDYPDYGNIQEHASHWDGTNFYCYYRDNAATGYIDYYYGTPETGWTPGTLGVPVDTNGGSFMEDGLYWWTYRTGASTCKVGYGTTPTAMIESWTILTGCQGIEIRPDRLSKYHYWMSYGQLATRHVGMKELSREITGNSTYVSSTEDTVYNTTGWYNLEWDAGIPSDSEMTVQFQTSNDTVTWTSWGTVTNATNISQTGRYGRFRMIMNSTNGYTSPTVEAVRVDHASFNSTWELMTDSTDIKTTATNPYSCGAMNDSSGNCTASFQVWGTTFGDVELRTYANSTEVTATSDDVLISLTYRPTVGSETYNSSAYETTSQTFTIVFEVSEDVWTINASLVYDGTSYGYDTRTTESNNRTFSKTITVPLVTVNETDKSFHWNVTVDYYTEPDDTYNTDSNNQALTFAYWPGTATKSSSNLIEGEDLTINTGITDLLGVATLTMDAYLNDTNYTMTRDGSTFTGTFNMSMVADDVYNYSVIFNTSLSVSYGGISRIVNTTTDNTTVHKIVLTNCTGSMGGIGTLHFYLKDEDDDSAVTGDLDITFDVWKDTDMVRSFSWGFTGANNYQVCIYPNWTSYQVDSMMQYEATGYSPRSYYLDNASISNTSQDLDLFLKDNTTTDLVTMEVLNALSLPEAGVFINIQRYYINTNTYETVAILETNFDGQAATYLTLNTVWYRFTLTQDGEVLEQYSPTVLTETTITFRLSAGELGEWFQYYDNIAFNCTWPGNTTTCTVIDTSGLMVSSELAVKRWTSLGYIDVCSTSSTSSSSTLVCSMGVLTGRLFWYELTADFASTDIVLESGFRDHRTTPGYGMVGVLAALMLMMVMIFMGIYRWEISLAFCAASVGVSSLMGILIVSYSSIVAGFVVVGVAIYKSRSS